MRYCHTCGCAVTRMSRTGLCGDSYHRSRIGSTRGPQNPFKPDMRHWWTQSDRLVHDREAMVCRDKWCKGGVAA